MKGTLVRLPDGAWGVSYTSTQDGVPLAYTLVWRVQRVTEGARYLAEGIEVCSSPNGNWAGQTARGDWVGVWFPGTQLAEVKTETPVPPPRTRLETRWHQGAWQKRRKEGWVRA